MGEAKFEENLERLEQIVRNLEEGNLPLDEALKQFEEGVKRARRCDKLLSEAEKKVEILLKNANGELEAEPFGEESEKPAASAPPANARFEETDYRPSTYDASAPADDEEDDEDDLLF